jgi:hypothetical protein
MSLYLKFLIVMLKIQQINMFIFKITLIFVHQKLIYFWFY